MLQNTVGPLSCILEMVVGVPLTALHSGKADCKDRKLERKRKDRKLERERKLYRKHRLLPEHNFLHQRSCPQTGHCTMKTLHKPLSIVGVHTAVKRNLSVSVGIKFTEYEHPAELFM